MRKTKRIVSMIMLVSLLVAGVWFVGQRNNAVLAEESESFLNMLSVKCQTKLNDNGRYNVRVVTTVENTADTTSAQNKYEKVGFEVTILNQSGNASVFHENLEITEGYERIITSTESGIEYNFSPMVFDEQSGSFATYTLTNIHESYKDNGILIRPYVVLKDSNSTKTYGTSKYFMIQDGSDSNDETQNEILTLPLTSDEYALLKDSDCTANYGADSKNYDVQVYKVNADDVSDDYAYARISVDSTTLPSVSEWTITNGQETVEKEYRNLYSKLSGSGSSVVGDQTWYDSSKTTHMIVTAADLYGLKQLINSDGVTFDSSKTIYLANDIVVNDEVGKNLATATNPNVWTPITKFGGTFDGNDHFIKGLYMNGAGQNFFIKTASNCTIKDVRFVGGYTESTGGGNATVAETFTGTMSGVYSDTIFNVNVGDGISFTGGLIACSAVGTSTIENCWYAGEITSDGYQIGGIAGVASVSASGVTVEINNCLVTGAITCKKAYNSHCGGFVGNQNTANTTLTVKNSIFAGDIIYDGNTTGQYWGLGSTGIIVGICNATGNSIITENVYSVKRTGIYRGDLSTNPVELYDIQYVNGNVNGTAINGQGELYNLTTRPGNDNMKGAIASKNMSGLNFDTVWMTRADDYPILRNFEDMSTTECFEINWYGADILLDSYEDLYEFNIVAQNETFSGKTIKLGTDIIVNGGDANKWADGTEPLPKNVWTAIPKFEGTLDGCNHSIKGLYMNGAGGNFFIKTASNCTIKDVRFVGGYTKSMGGGNATVAETFSGTMSGVYSDTIFNVSVGEADSLTGGLIMCGATGNATIEDCWYAGEITTDGRKIGGITAYVSAHQNVQVSIQNCLVTGAINCGVNYNSKAGGFVGEHNTANVTLNISDSVFAGDIMYQGAKELPYWGLGSTGALLGICGQTSNNITTSNIYSVKRTGIYRGDQSTTPIELYDIENVLGTVNGKTYSSYSGGLYDLSVRLDAGKLQDKAAYENTWLDFDTKWVMQANNYPIPQALKDMAKNSLITSTDGLERTYDIRWYDRKATEMVIDSREDLYGLYIMSQQDTFKGKTIKLGADIVVNEGDASKWADGTEALPKNVWTAIPKFEGTLDGGNHSIKGLYMNGAGGNFFIKTASNCTIKDVRFVGGYTKSTGSGNATVAETFTGTMSGVYSDTIFDVNSGESRTGGLIMCALGTAAINNCWVAGEITTTGNFIGGIASTVSVVDGVAIEIENCLVTAKITCKKAYNSLCGGFVGQQSNKNESLTVKNSIFAGNIIYAGDTTGQQYYGLGSTGIIAGICYPQDASNSITTENVYSVDITELYRNDKNAGKKDSLCDTENAQGIVNGTTYSNLSGRLYNLTIRPGNDAMKGNDARTNMSGLNFDTVWATRENDYPILEQFKDLFN